MKNSTKPLPQHINDFLDFLEIEKGLSSKTQENYSRFLKKFLVWLEKNNLEKLLPHQLTADHVWKYRVYLSRQNDHSGSPLKKNTQNYYLIALRSLLNYFSKRDINSLPSDKIELSRQKEEKPVRFLNLDQLKRLLDMPNIDNVAGIRDRAILETFFSTGMRISELVSLNCEQIKLAQGKNDFELAIVGKGQKTRTVYFSPRALEWIRKYLQTRKDNFKPLFINYRTRQDCEKRLTPRYIEKVMKHYIIKAGLPLNTTPHVLRHTFATDLLSQGVDIRILQEFLGHKSITATQIYTHVTSKKLREIHKEFHSLN
jgi:site-specific recombinase XerD